jgi:glyoxylase-like metal-dependent hydrolase (beta-lactamase superfamily II)
MSTLTRRAFLGTAAGCGGYVLAALAGATAETRSLFAAEPRGSLVSTEPWGRLERVADGVWMLISTPLAGSEASGAMRTFSNGGIVAGREGVLAIEGFASVEGARWLAGEAQRLTGRWPTHAVLTHYHGDHSAGLGGYEGRDGYEGEDGYEGRDGYAAPVALLGTVATRDLLARRHPGHRSPESASPGPRDRARPRLPAGAHHPA